MFSATLENDLGLGLLAAFQPGKKPKASAAVKDICVTRMKACKKISAIPSLRQVYEHILREGAAVARESGG